MAYPVNWSVNNETDCAVKTEHCFYFYSVIAENNSLSVNFAFQRANLKKWGQN